MKRHIVVIISLLIGLVAMAKAPGLNVEKLFDGSYNSDKSVSVIVSRSKEKYFRSINVENNEALVKKVAELFKKDLERADKSQDIIDKGRLSYSSMTIINNDYEIKIGLSYSSDNSCYLFIKGEPEAFK